ncbi:LysR family transcriptional regulator [Microbacterium sp. SS28]|uniref:LysR family transcriptional regulator n=1 Tax=Microbacterium sp. SS28 TaxID=2919948 RepID=UPI001FAB087A|nr:LysR family transcriptional regulator [Microbacterium sp. SS28]
MLDLKKLRLLRELHLRGTIAAVAESAAYSPSAVSQHLAQLEREAGVELLRKSGRGLRLTPAAERLVARTADLLDVMELAEAELRTSGEDVVGTVRAAVFQSAMLALMPAALEAMRTVAPDVRVELVQREPETALRETWLRDFDLVVAEHYPAHAAPHHPGLDRQPLTTDAIRLAVAVEHSAIDSVAAARDLPWVMEPRGAASRHYAEQQCRAAGFEPDVRYETADLQAHVRLVETGNAAALLPDLIWTGAEPSGCRLVDLPGSPRRTVFTSARSSGSEFPAVAVFRRVLAEVAAALTAR